MSEVMNAVPAWRRLGLTLKRERDQGHNSPEHPSPSSAERAALKSLPIGNEPATAAALASGEKAPKRRKIDAPSANGHKPLLINTPKDRPASTPKTVSFASDTKPDSSPDIAAGSKVQQQGTLREDVDAESDDDTEATIASRRLEKRQKREQRRHRSADAGASSAPPRPFLAYIRDYSEARNQWKFNKNHQNQLFKHLFDVYKVPSEYDDALVEYVAGLQGGAARSRILESAEKIATELKDDPEAQPDPDDMEDEETRAHWHDVARKRDAKIVKSALKKRFDEAQERQYNNREFPAKLLKRQRAERIMEAIRGSDTHLASKDLKQTRAEGLQPLGKTIDDGQRQGVNGTSKEASKKRSRGRKRRGLATNIPDDDEVTDSSSSSSAISSSSSEDESSSDDETGPNQSASSAGNGPKLTNGTSTKKPSG